MATHAALGKTALEAGNLVEALFCYNQAIAEIPTSPDYYIQRSTVYQRQSPADFESALQDAETAVRLAYKRAKRELIATAQLRRGIALFSLKRFGDAQRCFEWTKARNEKERLLAVWISRVEAELTKLVDEDPEASSVRVSVKEIPQALSDVKGKKVVRPDAPTTTSKTQGSVQTPADKIRHEWYQTSENVVLTLFVKGVPKDKATIEIYGRSVSISFPMPNGSTYDFSLEPLFGQIIANTSTSAVMSTKIEVILKKAYPGQKWHSLEGGKDDESEISTLDSGQNTAAGTTPGSTSQSTGALSYPTSSRSKSKNWDQIAASYTKKPKKGKGDDNPAEGNAEDDDYIDEDDMDGDPVNGFFKKLYADADPDTRRAMMKSFQESNGTALSTNWKEVGQAKVETTPPDGMVAKKWES